MSELRLTLQGDGLDKTIRLAQKLENKALMYPAFSRALNHTANVAKTATYRALAPQTGLPIRVTRKAIRVKPSSAATLEAALESSGGDVGLKYFRARETRGGVSAAPFNQRRVFPLTFIRGGLWPKRVDIGRGGTVFRVTGGTHWGRPFTKAKSGVIIPEQMITGQSADAFMRTAEQRLPPRIMHEVKRIAGGLLA